MIAMLNNALTILKNELITWGEATISLVPNILLAGIITLLTFLAGKWARRLTYKRVKASDLKDTLSELLSTTVYIAILLTGGFFALESLHLDKAVTSLLAGAGIIGLALAFAFQDIASNFVSGIILAVKDIFHVGDLVETNGYFGTVNTIDLRTTTIKTTSGELVMIPNSDLLSNPLTNYSAIKERRVDVSCGVGYDDDLESAKSAVKETVKSLSFVSEEKDVDFLYNEFGDSSVNFVVRFWIDFDQSNKAFVQAKSDAIQAIKERLDDDGFDIPYPIRTIDVNDATASVLQR